jgi:pentatricopeptide repeat protein
MTAAGVVPDEYTYASLITACGNSGQPEQAVQLLRDMTNTTNDNDADSSSNSSGAIRTAGLFSYNAAIGACDKVCVLLLLLHTTTEMYIHLLVDLLLNDIKAVEHIAYVVL